MWDHLSHARVLKLEKLVSMHNIYIYIYIYIYIIRVLMMVGIKSYLINSYEELSKDQVESLIIK